MRGSVLDVCSGQLNISNLSLFLELLFYLQPHRCAPSCPMKLLPSTMPCVHAHIWTIALTAAGVSDCPSFLCGGAHLWSQR